MKRLPLYTDKRAVIEHHDPIVDLDKKCTRCKLHEAARTVCMGSDGLRPYSVSSFEGSLLVLGDFPTSDEDDAARPVSCGPNVTLRETLEELHTGPVVYSNAIRCAPKGRNITDTMVAACSGYTRGLIDEVKPDRILCFGKRAYQTILGSKCDSIQLGRRGYGYLSDGTPVFMLHPARRVTPNRFLLKKWQADIKWALDTNPPLPPWDGVILEIETVEDAEAACEELAASGLFTFDTETGGLMGDDYFQVVCLTATPSHDLDVSYLWTEEAIQNPALLAPLRRLLSDGSVLKGGHNLKYDFEASAYGLNLMDDRGVLLVKGAGAHTLLWVRSTDTESKGALDHADHHVGMGGHKAANKAAVDAACELIGRYRANPRQTRLRGHTHPALEAALKHPDVDAKSFAYALVPRQILYRYCALDTVATARLERKYRPIIDGHPSRKRVSEELQLAPTEAIAQLESWGMSADINAARAFGTFLTPRRDEYLRKIRALGCEIDINSSDQLSNYLFNTLGLPVQEVSEKTQQPRVNAASLQKLKDHHEVVQHLLDYSKVNKLISTYVDGLIPHIRPDGRIRSTLNIAGARSGRMSSSNPNLQNIPSGGEYAKMAKAIFNTPPGHVLLQLDYSQLEVRIAAMLSQDKSLIQAYKDGVDVHRRTASAAFHVPEDQITKDQRRSAKTVVFGVLYGKSPRSLSADLGLPLEEGQAIYDSVLGGLPSLNEWMREQRAYAQKHGVIWTYIPTEDGRMERARCRQLWQIAEPDSKVASTGRNGAVNTPVQGSASDFMLRTVVAVVNWIVGDHIPARVTNTVHDSIILEVPYAWALEVAGMVKHIMEAWPSCGVPLVADVDVGLTWGSLFKLEGIQIVASGKRNGLSDSEILHVAKGDKDLSEEIEKMGDKSWLNKVWDLAQKVAA